MLITCAMLLLTIQREDTYEFVPSIRRVTSNIGDIQCEGIIDAKGTFVPDLKSLQRGLSANLSKEEVMYWASWPAPIVREVKVNDKLYEFRSGMLIPVTMSKDKQLIPDAGGTIIDFKDYHYSPTARRIYNLPGLFVLKKDEPAKKP